MQNVGVDPRDGQTGGVRRLGRFQWKKNAFPKEDMAAEIAEPILHCTFAAVADAGKELPKQAKVPPPLTADD